MLLQYFNIKNFFLGMQIPIMNIRQLSNCLVFIMGIPILARKHTKMTPGSYISIKMLSYQFWISHCWDKMVWWFHFCDGISCIVKAIIFIFKQALIGQTVLNSSSLSAAYMHQWIRSALVQIMTCRLFGAKPLSEPVLVYCQLDTWEHTSMKF